MSDVTFAHLYTVWRWRPIPDCPGRFVHAEGVSALRPHDLVGPNVELHEVRVAAARDPVVIGRLPDGGLISYKRADGTYVHTLNTPEGFERKLLQLGISTRR